MGRYDGRYTGVGGGGGGLTEEAAAEVFAPLQVVDQVDADENPGSSGSFVDLTTPGPTVTVDVPASGNVMVTISAYMGVAGGDQTLSIGVDLSGANTVAANGTDCLSIDITTLKFRTVTSVLRLTGLTPGETTFTAKYQKSGGSASFSRRLLAVQPDPLA